MDFGAALSELKRGKSLSRAGWNGRNQYVKLQRPTVDSKMSFPYFYIRTVQGSLVPWLPSHTDLMSEDWRVVGITRLPAAAPGTPGCNVLIGGVA